MPDWFASPDDIAEIGGWVVSPWDEPPRQEQSSSIFQQIPREVWFLFGLLAVVVALGGDS